MPENTVDSATSAAADEATTTSLDEQRAEVLLMLTDTGATEARFDEVQN